MQFVLVVFASCIAAISCQVQSQGPPSQMTKPAPPIQYELKGCRPGCTSTGICAELEPKFCEMVKGQGRGCSVCVKMSSIRFPAAAISGIFKPPTAPVAVPQLPAAGSGGIIGAGYPQQQMQQQMPQQTQRQSGAENFLFPAMMMGMDFGMF